MGNIRAMLLALAALAAAPAPAAAWEKLATRDVGDRVDRDSVNLPGDRLFSRLRVCVERRAVHFIDLDVRFANGGGQDAPVRALIRAPQCTRAIDFNGGPRNLAAIHFVYEAQTRRRGTSATITVWGE